MNSPRLLILHVSAAIISSLGLPFVSAGQTNATTEARNDAAAYSVLIESYRQIQRELVRIDHEARLGMAAALRDRQTRREAAALAAKECELRMKKVGADVARLRRAYESTRDPAALSTLDTRRAAEQLKEFVVPGPLETLPASAVLPGAEGRPCPYLGSGQKPGCP